MAITAAQAMAQLKKQKQPHAKWRLTHNNETNEWEGTCQKCNHVVAAVTLVLHRLPFGRGEQWQCKGGCLND